MYNYMKEVQGRMKTDGEIPSAQPVQSKLSISDQSLKEDVQLAISASFDLSKVEDELN